VVSREYCLLGVATSQLHKIGRTDGYIGLCNELLHISAVLTFCQQMSKLFKCVQSPNGKVKSKTIGYKQGSFVTPIIAATIDYS